jgi:glycosyltransferase involved in cell wall biosynthesis
MMLSRSAQVVFIANHVQDYFAGICGSNKPHWRYIPNGVDSKVFNTSTIQADQDSDLLSQLPEGQFVLFVGRFVEKKGLLFLKDLVRNCDDIQWVFAGRGPIDPQLWGSDNVTTISHMDHESVAELYSRASLLVLPSVGEGFPLVIQEAVACGIPVLTSNEASRGCIEADSFLFRSDIQSKDAVSNWEIKIRDLLNDKESLANASAEGALFAEKNWNWNSISKSYEAIFRQACS